MRNNNTCLLEAGGKEMRKSLILLLFTGIVLSGCANQLSAEQKEKNSVYLENKEIIGSERDKMFEQLSDTIYEISERSNSAAETFGITLVDTNHEFSVPGGRYNLMGDISGTVTILDENGDILIKEVINNISGLSEGITADIQDNHIIRVNGFEHFWMNPIPTEVKSDLGTGIWHVGVDIEPGNYTVTSQYGFGHLEILHPEKEPQVIEIISGPYGNTASDVELEEGQVLRIPRDIQLSFKEK